MAIDDEALRVQTTSAGIVVIGEIDAHTVPVLRAPLLSARESGDLRMDVSGVSFVDSSGLRVLLEAHRELERTGRRLVLVAPSRPVVRLIELAGLVDHLHIEPHTD